MRRGSLIRNRRGVSMVEYALLAALIALIAVGAVRLLGGTVSGAFTDIEAEF